jgi:hypothetical protein
MQLLFEKLNNVNYVEWVIKMEEALLEEKDLWEVVSGDEVEPSVGPSSKAMKTFQKKQQLAKVRITLHVKNSQLPHIRFNSPKKIWENLTMVHQSHGFGMLLATHHWFFSLKKDPNQSMQAWIATVQTVTMNSDLRLLTSRSKTLISLSHSLKASLNHTHSSLSPSTPHPFMNLVWTMLSPISSMKKHVSKGLQPL